MDTMSLKNAILEGVLSAVRSHPSVTLGQLGDVEALGFDLRAVPVSALLSAGGFVPMSIGYGETIDASFEPSKLDPAIGAKTRTKVHRENFDAAVLWVVAERDPTFPDEGLAWSSIEVGDSLAERGHGNASASQLRKSLHRLIALKQVKSTGKARGTRYTATAKGVKAFEKMGAA